MTFLRRFTLAMAPSLSSSATSLENEIKEKQRLKLKKEKKVIFLFAITSLRVAFPGVILFFLSPSLLHHVVLEEIGEMAGALSYIRRLPPF
jgi:hypothetical protein